MGAGKRTERVRIERETRVPDEGGGAANVWSQIGEAWADVVWIRGGEAQRQGAFREVAVYRFTVLSAAIAALEITTKDRLVWGGEIYNIRERPRVQTRGVETDIIAETGVSQ